MKLSYILPLASVASAFVVPDQQLFSSLNVERHNRHDSPISHAWETSEQTLRESFKCATNTWEDAAQYTQEVKENAHAWAAEKIKTANNVFDRPHKPHHRPHHHKPNQTVYELINGSKYTTKLAKLINDDSSLVKLLNGTTANFTVFAPTDRAFEKVPCHHISSDFIKKLLLYHVSTDFYPAGRVLVSKTIPSALEGEHLGKGNLQRISTQVGITGLTLNFYARVVAIDIFGTNGVIHGLDSLLFPPPNAVDILSLLPGEFSTLELGLFKTGLLETLNDTSLHAGGTLFAPSNFAFKLLGPRINAFLFSSYGEKYLRALLKYHVSANYTLYSDAFYKSDATDSGIPKGVFHVDLPTLLGDRHLGVDVARFGRLITIRINGFNRVSISDGIAADGVIHVVPNVLIPPKTPGGVDKESEIELEDLKERLAPYVKADDWTGDL